MAVSIDSRDTLYGSSRSGAMAPTARHGLNWLGNVRPAKSPPKARSSGFASDLKMKIRIPTPVFVAAFSLLLIVPSRLCKLPPAELITLRRATDRSGSFVLVAKDHTSFFQIIGRHFHCHPVPGKGLDPVLLHSAGGIDDERMAVIELNAISRVGQYLGDKAFELQEFFFRHVLISSNEGSAAARVEQRRAQRGCGAA